VADFAEKIADLTPDPDGAVTDFAVPTRFVLGSLRAIVNGLVTPADDDQWGYTELDEFTIRFTNPPKTGFRLQAFYREPYAEGSPFQDGVIP
jgi:hypothetical protein